MFEKNDFCKGPSVYRGCGSNGANLYLDDIFDVNYAVYLILLFRWEQAWTSRASGRQTERADCNYLKN